MTRDEEYNDDNCDWNIGIDGQDWTEAYWTAEERRRRQATSLGENPEIEYGLDRSAADIIEIDTRDKRQYVSDRRRYARQDTELSDFTDDCIIYKPYKPYKSWKR